MIERHYSAHILDLAEELAAGDHIARRNSPRAPRGRVMAKRGRKAAPAPPGVRRIEKHRHGVRIWLECARGISTPTAGLKLRASDRHGVRTWFECASEDDPPTAELKLRASDKPAGRPMPSIDEAKKLFSLEVLTSLRMGRGESLKSALYGAMRAMNWPDQGPAEHKRLAERHRARRLKPFHPGPAARPG